MHVLSLLACALIPSLLYAHQNVEQYDYDIIVYGATPAGIQAAVSAVKEGFNVLLTTPATIVGGMMTGGLGKTDVGNWTAIGGASATFFYDICTAYQKPVNPGLEGCYEFEPHVASNVFDALIAAAGPNLTVKLNSTLVAVTLVSNGKGIGSVSFTSTAEAVAADTNNLLPILARNAASTSARVFIDATYEGDLIAMANISTAIGRESSAQYNESHGGVLPEPNNFGAHQFKVFVDAFDHSTGATIPLVDSTPPGPVGSGDVHVQSYNFRVCMTTNVSNQVKWTKPVGYDPKQWELGRRYLAAANKSVTSYPDLMNLCGIPHSKTDTNNNGPFSTDVIGASWGWPAATPAQRVALYNLHADYTLGFFWFLASDPAVPQLIQTEANRYGLCADEFSGKLSPQLYVREGRRMIGDWVFTQQDREFKHPQTDSIGLFSYNIDSHNTQRYVDSIGGVRNEGDFELWGGSNGQMPYRLMLPARADAAGSNVLAPVPLSASHMGYGCLRLEPQLMILGQAAGVAAAQALKENVDVQNIDVAKLQARLLELGAKIDI